MNKPNPKLRQGTLDMLVVKALWISRLPLCGTMLAGIAWGAPPSAVVSVSQKMPVVNRDRLPPALRNVRLEHLSSGALMLLNQNDLVQPSAAWFSNPATTSHSNQAGLVALDRRVGANIRLGDDPPALPPNMRAQAEPHIARSLIDPDFLAATFQEGRFTDAGAVDCGYSISHDGGLTWMRSLIPNLTQTSGGPYVRATDPVAAFDLNNAVYLETLATTDSQFNNSLIVVSRSTNSGQTFGSPFVAYTPPPGVFPDKDWMAINTFPGTATVGRVVATFTRFTNASINGAPISRVISDNGGVTWGAEGFVTSSSTEAQGSQPVFLPNGNLVVVYWNFGTAPSPGERLEAVISTDSGDSFGSPKLITSAVEYNEPRIRTGSILPSAAVDRTSGNIYVVYQTLLAGNPRIAFAKSTDGGNNWIAPIAISDNPANSGVFNPAINVSPDGQKLTVAFYDHRDNPGSNVLVDLYFAQSFDGGATWQPNIRLTSVSTNASLAPLSSSGYMLGDYLGVAEATNVNVPAIPVWVDTRTGNPDPFIVRVGIAPQVDFTSWEAARLSLHQINDSALGGPAGDADGDGEDNFSEFQSMTDPNDPNSVVHTGKQLNISTRLNVFTDDNVGIAGFIVTGTDPKRVVLRAIGPSLTPFGVQNALQDPTLELHNQSTGATIAFNNNWKDSQQTDIQNTGLAPSDDREAAMVQILPPGAYSAIMRGNGNTTGVGLVEVYDVDPNANATLANISTRGFADTGDNIMIGGVIVGRGLGVNGAGSAKVLVRGIGPSLITFGIANALQDPTLELRDGNGALIASDDDWKDTQQAEIQATGLAPSDDRESAILATVTQGNHTVILRGENNTTGVALVEVYNLQ
jgi:BNR repeat protein